MALERHTIIAALIIFAGCTVFVVGVAYLGAELLDWLDHQRQYPPKKGKKDAPQTRSD